MHKDREVGDRVCSTSQNMDSRGTWNSRQKGQYEHRHGVKKWSGASWEAQHYRITRAEKKIGVNVIPRRYREPKRWQARKV